MDLDECGIEDTGYCLFDQEDEDEWQAGAHV